jgi:hypothetical protein
MRVVPKAIAEQKLRFVDGEPQMERMNLIMDEGIGFQAGMDGQVLQLLTHLSGSRTLREALVEGAKSAGVTDLEGYARAGLPAARRMFELGFLERIV